jgi:hypothetical protein
MWNLRTVSMCESMVDLFDEDSLFSLQFNLSASSPMAISINMDWEAAGQLPLKDAIRILETMVRKNDELARDLKDK